MKENEDDINKDTCVHGLEELVLLNCPHYPKRSTGST